MITRTVERAAYAVDRLPILKRPAVDLREPVFIWGFGQSGTYLLYDAMSLSGDAAFFYTRGYRKKGLFDPKYSGHAWRGLRKRPVEGIVHFWQSSGLAVPPYDRVIGPAEPVDCDRVLEKYRTVHRDWIWRSGKKRILDKMPTYIFMVALIDRLFPDARHVFCLRDPRAVLNSVVKRFKRPEVEESWHGYPSGFYGDMMLEGWREVANQSLERRHAWQIITVMRIGLANRRLLGERLLLTRYEDFCADPQGELERILSHCGLSFDEAAARLLPSKIRALGSLEWPTRATTSAVPGYDIDATEFPHLDQLAEFAVALGYSSRTVGQVERAIDETRALQVASRA